MRPGSGSIPILSISDRPSTASTTSTNDHVDGAYLTFESALLPLPITLLSFTVVSREVSTPTCAAADRAWPAPFDPSPSAPFHMEEYNYVNFDSAIFEAVDPTSAYKPNLIGIDYQAISIPSRLVAPRTIM